MAICRTEPTWRLQLCLWAFPLVTGLLVASCGKGSSVAGWDVLHSEVAGDLERDGHSDQTVPSDLSNDVSVPVDLVPDGETADDLAPVELLQDGPAPDQAGPDADVQIGPDSDGLGQDMMDVVEEVGVPDLQDASEIEAEDLLIPDQVDLWPIPELDEEVSTACPAALEEEWYFQFLDNLCEEKVWPTSQDRDRMCPVSDPSPFMTLVDGTVVQYKPSSEPIVWDTQSLVPLMPLGMRMVVILVKRVNGVPHYRYLSNGTHDVPQQPWSTTKILAAANAAATIRIESDYTVGLTASAGAYKLGDLVTSVCNYDESPFTSNGLGKWFHNVGGRARANDLIHELWLQRPEVETFGGNYGEAAPPVPYTLAEDDGTSTPTQRF